MFLDESLERTRGQRPSKRTIARMSAPLQVIDVRTALREAMGRLRQGRVPSRTLAAELLLMHVLGRDRAWLYSHAEDLLDAASADRYFALVERRVAGTPTQYLTGHQEFWGLDFEVAPGVLIPRPETEHVIEVALERLGRSNAQRARRAALNGAGLRLVDVGTGSGCLAVALARELSEAVVFAVDISPTALAIARRNAARHGVGSRILFVQGNLLEAFLSPPTAALRATFDLVVSNPPYVGRDAAEQLPREIREHEPEQALFSGQQGFEIYEPVTMQAEQLLTAGGILVLELGYNSLPRVRMLLDSQGVWAHIAVTNDLAGIPRVLAAERL